MLKSYLLSCLLLEAATAQWFTRRPTPTPTRVAPPSATQSLYGQWPTICPPGAYCKFDGNIWYEQCVAIETDGGGQPSTRTATTVVTVGPTVVTTFITYLTPKPTTTRPAQVVTITVVPDDPCDHEYLC
ncbi:predicted protein [Chaetomium globosum CBS 148.51]|uniref:CBM1 domain-containing protein n=1 Tax=Chaetomium globosum (strain ATCC 6205 / CBS 148.51 / DSM 1962 / NBRC 6347 / NRRL 1970) TaxID=306901 RepID=Q2GYV5_CHAGB|nr:uncharacterized protein CHGG_06849 [Chaetomium globosum CBS 148.51]EAQ85596.1 predicted protein [Chaetomium globosum CBS 148.51]